MDRNVDGDLVELLADWASGRGPLYQKLSVAIGRLISDGLLDPGARLPSERRLAQALAISRSTVVGAYDELRARGLIASRPGSGTRLVGAARPGQIRGGQVTAIIRRLVDTPPDLISLSAAVEPAGPEVREAFAAVAQHDLSGLLTDAGYHPRGLNTLRGAIAVAFSRSGTPTAPDQIVVTTGASQAISLTTQLYVRKGATVLVESPSWPGCLDVFRAAGARLQAVPLDHDGIRIDLLERAMAEHAAALLYLTPTYQNPTGILTSASRRRRVAELAAHYDVPVLEDLAYSTRIERDTDYESPPAIAAYAPRDAEVVTVGSLAKSVWAGLRIGWARAPSHLADRLARLKALADLGSPLLDQALAARLLPTLPTLDTERAKTMRARLDLMCEQLTKHLATWRWDYPAGGSALWINLPDTNAQAFAQLALRHGAEVIPGHTMDPSGAHDSYIRLPYTFPETMTTEVVRRLTATWNELQRHGPSPTMPDHLIV